jgi:hypothetical protein
MTTWLRDEDEFPGHHRAEHPLVGLGLCALSVAAVLALALHVSVEALECGLGVIGMLGLAGIVYGATRR